MANINWAKKILNPRLPSAAASIEQGRIVVLQLEKSRGGHGIRHAAALSIPEELIRPDFSADSNIHNLDEAAAALSEAAASAGLAAQSKWSVALPEGSTRTIIMTIDSPTASKQELEEIFLWKVERGFGSRFEDLQIARESISADANSRPRFIVTAVRKSVLAEFETVFETIGWRAGMILPRSVAEARWFTVGRSPGDSLLLSSFVDGFTAAIYRGDEPVVVRSVVCEGEDRHDELYRFLMFYRDRLASEGDEPGQTSLSRMLVAGEGFSSDLIDAVVEETFETAIPVANPAEFGLAIPSSEFNFSDLAAPAALATMAW
jgi:Tfp pilus assembly PilM family ATPase